MDSSDCQVSFAALMDRVRAGSEEAAWELIERYGDQIQRFVRRLLHMRLRSQFDSTDFVQLVWLSFFRDPEKIRSFSSPEELAAYLIVVARNKVIDETRRCLSTKKKNVRRVRAYDDEHNGIAAIADRGPTPSAIVVARERWERIIKGQPAHYQELARLRFMGVSNDEIAHKLGINERTVRKILNHLLQLQTA